MTETSATTQTDYQQIGRDFLSRHGITFTVQFVGNDCPEFCEDAQKGRGLDERGKFPRKTHIHGAHYVCRFRRIVKAETLLGVQDKQFHIDFHNSYHDEEFNWLFAQRNNAHSAPVFGGDWKRHGFKVAGRVAHHEEKEPRHPTPYDVLACLTKSYPGSFEDFCGDYGYDTDSRKAERVYFAVQAEWAKVSAFFTAEEIEEMQEIN